VHPPIVFITGHGDIPSSVRTIQGGAVDFLTKPVGENALVAAVQAAIDRDRVQRSVRAELEQTCSAELISHARKIPRGS
jgi:FixJ family two-component response regulator